MLKKHSFQTTNPIYSLEKPYNNKLDKQRIKQNDRNIIGQKLKKENFELLKIY